MLFPTFVLGAIVGVVLHAVIWHWHLRSLRHDLADEIRHELVDEFEHQFRHIVNQLDYLEQAMRLSLPNPYDVGVPAPRLPGSRVS
jgi:hypothetical protein